MHVMYVALHEVTWCMVVWCTQNMCQNGGSFTLHHYSECAVKSKSRISNDTRQEHSESVQDQRTALYKSDQQEEMKTAVSKCG